MVELPAFMFLNECQNRNGKNRPVFACRCLRGRLRRFGVLIYWLLDSKMGVMRYTDSIASRTCERVMFVRVCACVLVCVCMYHEVQKTHLRNHSDSITHCTLKKSRKMEACSIFNDFHIRLMGLWEFENWQSIVKC